MIAYQSWILLLQINQQQNKHSNILGGFIRDRLSKNKKYFWAAYFMVNEPIL